MPQAIDSNPGEHTGSTERGSDLDPGLQGRTSRSRVVSGSMYGLLSYVLYIPIAFVVIRYTVDRVGTESYGVWAALTTVSSLQGLLDFGVAAPVIKYVAEYWALDRRDAINVVVGTAMVFYATVGVTVGAILLVISNWLVVHLLHASAGNTTYRFMYISVVVTFVFALVFSVLSSVLVGIQRADLWGKLNLAYNLQTAVGTVIFLGFLNMGLNGLVVNYVAGVFLLIVANWVLLRRLLPQLRLNPFLFRRSELRKMLGFSSKIQVSVLTLFMNMQVDRVVITYALGPVSLAYYQLASRVSTALQGVGVGIERSVLPAASEYAITDRQRLIRLYLRGTRYEALIILPLCAAIGVLAYPLSAVWLGPGFGQVAATMMILVVGYAAWLPNGVTCAVLNSINRPDIRMRVDVVFIIVHIPLAVVLVWRFGYFGTVCATTSLFFVTRLIIYVQGAHTLGTRVRDLISVSFAPPALGSLVAALTVLAMQVAGVPVDFIGLTAEALMFGAVYIGYMLLVGFDSYDWELIASLQAGAFRRLPARIQRIGRRRPNAA